MNTELETNSNTHLTKHFTLNEFTRSATARKHCIINDPPAEVIPLIFSLSCILECVRAKINSPIFITSGYRSPELNKFVGGVPNSKHTLGLAVDFTFDDFDKNLPIVIKELKRHPYRFLKVYSDRHFIHVDFPSESLKLFNHETY